MYDALKIQPKHAKDLDIWNLRGENTFIEKLTPILLRRAKDKDYDAIIFDPLYKINKADENSASEMGEFFNYLDHVCKKLGASIICCHHHSKGSQSGKSSIDRASGSGVFARDPDALMDMIRINTEDVDMSLDKGETAWRISSTLREFESPEDIDVIFSHPVHRITEDLKDAEPMYGVSARTNSTRGNKKKSNTAKHRYNRLLNVAINWSAYDQGTGTHTKYPTINDLVEHFKSEPGYSANNIRRWIKDHPEDLVIVNGMIMEPNESNAEL